MDNVLTFTITQAVVGPSGDLRELLLEMPLHLSQVLHTLCCNAFQGLFCMPLSFFRCRSLRNNIIVFLGYHFTIGCTIPNRTPGVTVGLEINALPVNQLLGISNGTGTVGIAMGETPMRP